MLIVRVSIRIYEQHKTFSYFVIKSVNTNKHICKKVHGSKCLKTIPLFVLTNIIDIF